VDSPAIPPVYNELELMFPLFEQFVNEQLLAKPNNPPILMLLLFSSQIILVEL